MSSSGSEAELVARAVAGEDQALERLLLEHHDSLRWKLAGEVPASMRGFLCDEDILQQTYVEVFRSIRSFEPKGDRSFRAWLFTIAQHRLHDAIKAHRAAKRGGGQPGLNLPVAVGDSTDELIDLLAGSKGTPSQSVARHEAARAVHAALASLGADHRRVIQLRHLQGLPVAEVARQMDRTEHAVHNLCARALRELRVVLGCSSQFFSRR